MCVCVCVCVCVYVCVCVCVHARIETYTVLTKQYLQAVVSVKTSASGLVIKV